MRIDTDVLIRLVEEAGYRWVVKPGADHYQIQGGLYLLNVYPDKGTVYVDGGPYGHHVTNPAAIVRWASKPPRGEGRRRGGQSQEVRR